jgi:hypothetical protein
MQQRGAAALHHFTETPMAKDIFCRVEKSHRKFFIVPKKYFGRTSCMLGIEFFPTADAALCNEADLVDNDPFTHYERSDVKVYVNEHASAELIAKYEFTPISED